MSKARLTRTEDAFEQKERYLTAKRMEWQIRLKFLFQRGEAARFLKSCWHLVAGDIKHWSQFCEHELEDDPKTVEELIRLYEIYKSKLGIDDEVIAKVRDRRNLVALLPHLSKENANELLKQAALLPREDLRKWLLERAGKWSETEHVCVATTIHLVKCKECGRRME